MSQTSHAPSVSVIMSTYNCADTIRESVDSILNQTFRDFEFIIVDDGSKDSTYSILIQYAKKDDRIKILKNQKNLGLTRSLNRAIKQARGVIIARQDADDVSLPQRFAKQMKYFHKNPKYSMLGTNFIAINESGREIGRSKLPTNLKKITRGMDGDNYFCHTSVMIRADVLKSLGGYENRYRYSQDSELWLRLLSKGYLAKNLTLPLVKFRVGRKSTTDRTQQIWTSIKIRLKYYPFFWYNWRYNFTILYKLLRILLPRWLRRRLQTKSGYYS